MIRLNVEGYCHDCPDFEPVVERFYGGNEPVLQVVTCTNSGRCQSIARHILEQVKEKNDEKI